MVPRILAEWLKEFHSYVGEIGSRRSLLITENMSCHGTEYDLPYLLNTEVIFFVSRNSVEASACRFRNNCIFKKQLSTQANEFGFGKFWTEIKKFYDVDQLTAMKWMSQIWEELKEEIISNCWCWTGFIATSNSVRKSPRIRSEIWNWGN